MGRSVRAATLDEFTADLELDFHDNLRLDVFNDSSGFEGGRCVTEMAGCWSRPAGAK